MTAKFERQRQKRGTKQIENYFYLPFFVRNDHNHDFKKANERDLCLKSYLKIGLT